MKKSNFAVIRELKVILRRIDRLREGFGLEKDAAVEAQDIKSLEDLRERSRSHYRLRLSGLSRRALMLRRNIFPDQAGREEAEDLAEACRREAAGLDAHLVSTPSRLLRALGSNDPDGE